MDSEVELLLESVKEFVSKSLYEGRDWESIKTKYERIRSIFVERYPRADANNPENVDENFPKSKNLGVVTKERIAAKVKYLRKNYKKAVDTGKRSGGERIVMTFSIFVMTFGPALLQLVLKVNDSLNCTFIANLVYYFLEALSQYVLFSGGIESSALAQGTANTSAASASLDHPNEEGDNSDENCNDTPRLSDSVSTPQISKKSEQSDRREKISKFLSEQREKKMASKKSVESQQLNILKEDLQLKRKRAEQDETLNKEFLSE